MPVSIGEEATLCDRICELVDKIDEHIATPQSPPIVNVDAPTINVEAKAPPPTVNVAAPAPHKPHPWTMTVHRNGEGLIQTITITPN